MMILDRIHEERVFRELYEGLFENLIDRNFAEVPDTFVPSARFVASVNDKLLSLTHPRGSQVRLRRAKQWVKCEDHELLGALNTNDRFLLARQYGADWDHWGETWAVERTDGVHQVLAFKFGPTPIFCFNPKAAMVLGERCYPSPRPGAYCLRWVPIAA